MWGDAGSNRIEFIRGDKGSLPEIYRPFTVSKLNFAEGLTIGGYPGHREIEEEAHNNGCPDRSSRHNL